MEEQFITAWLSARQQAEALGIRLRPIETERLMASAHRQLTGNRCSEGFAPLEAKGRLDLSLEALAVAKRFTGLFTDEEANNALTRLLKSGYFQ